MTTHETFKRRVRARMAKTGERYGAARRVLLDQTEARSAGRVWIAEPDTTDEALRTATGKGWNEWCDIIDAWPGHEEGHTAIATYLQAERDVDSWWSQSITVGWERITGRRVRHQQPDGTFQVTASKTVNVPADELRAMLLDESDRTDLFPGYDTELRSKPTTKNVRLRLGPGTAVFGLTPKPDGRTQIAVAFSKLSEAEQVPEWKAYWAEWLSAMDESG